MLPLDAAVVEIWVTMAPTSKPDHGGYADTEYFAVNYIPADGVQAFTIDTASCTLLFPYVAALMRPSDWNTGIAISNPSAFTDTPLAWKTSRSPCFRTMGICSCTQRTACHLGRVWTLMDFFLRGIPTPCCSAKILAAAGLLR